MTRHRVTISFDIHALTEGDAREREAFEMAFKVAQAGQRECFYQVTEVPEVSPIESLKSWKYKLNHGLAELFCLATNAKETQ